MKDFNPTQITLGILNQIWIFLCFCIKYLNYDNYDNFSKSEISCFLQKFERLGLLSYKIIKKPKFPHHHLRLLFYLFQQTTNHRRREIR